ncbi:unnamed protein product [Linum trigynum]
MATATEIIWSPWGPKTKVMITNEVGGGRQLTVHCSSFFVDNEDLGVHVVNPHDSYRFKFWIKASPPWFYCSMDWGAVGGPRWFDIYDPLRDADRCRSPAWCQWIVKESGPCTSMFGVQRCYPWKK